MTSPFAIINLSSRLAHVARVAVAARMGRPLSECDAGDTGRSVPRLLLRMSRLRCCLNIAVMLFASAVVRSPAPFGGRVFLVGGRTAWRGRPVMLSRCRAMVRCRNGPADQLLDIAKKRQFLRITE